MSSFDFSIQKSADFKLILLQTIEITQKKWTPANICKKVLDFYNKWLKLTISQKGFKTCLRKLTIIAPFHSSQQFFFYGQKPTTKSQIFFFFSKLPKKKCPGGRCLYRQRPQSVFEEDEAEEAAEKKTKKISTPDAVYIVSVFLKMKQKRRLKVHTPNVRRGTLILFETQLRVEG